MTVIDNADGKTTAYSGEILSALLSEVNLAKPEFLFLTGDLTYNGEKTSHEEPSAALKEVEKEGTEVLLIPGNHDLNNSSAYAYSEGSQSPTSSVSASEFEDLYWDVCYKKALYRDPNSLSYIYSPRTDLWFLFLDSESSPIAQGWITDETQSWLSPRLAEAKKKGIQVISFTHENLLLQNPLFADRCLLNYEGMGTLYRQYGLSANFSGHLHVQHFLASQGLSDIATSSLSVAPNHYAELDFMSEGWRYESHDLDVASWAKKTGKQDPNLLDFKAYSQNFFNATNRRRLSSRLANSSHSAAEQKAMLEAGVAVTAGYFAGTPTAKEPLQEGLDLWQAETQLTNAAYMRSMISEMNQDFRHYSTVSSDQEESISSQKPLGSLSSSD